MRNSLITWLASTRLNWFVNHYVWVWPASETLHFFGLCLLVGTVGMFDLRVLGVAKKLPAGQLHRLVRWGILGFAINVSTGILFFVGNPYRYLHNISFAIKMLLVLLAGANALIFERTMLRRVEALSPGEDGPRAAKVLAALSLLLWVGVMSLGRLITFLDDTI